MRRRAIIRGILILLLILVLAGLGWWYFFLRAQQASLNAADAGRGSAGAESASGNPIGSTYENIVSNPAPRVAESGVAPGAPPRLLQVAKTPIAGMGFVGKGAAEKLYFVERSSGYVLSADPQSGALTRLTNTLMPKIYEAIFAADGSVIERSVDEKGVVTSFSAVIATSSPRSNAGDVGSTTPGVLRGAFLPPGIAAITASPASREIFYVLADPKAGAVGVRAQWDGSKAKQIFASGISGWRARWLPDGRIILTQKASDDVAGYAYQLSADGSLLPLARDVPGLTFSSHASSSAFIEGSAAGGSLFLFGQAGKNASLKPIPLKTVADKCVWSAGQGSVAFCAVPQGIPGPGFLQKWYQGAAHTADSWWRVDAFSGEVELLLSPENEYNVSVDVENPIINAEGTVIAFMDADDKTPWLLRIEPQSAGAKKGN